VSFASVIALDSKTSTNNSSDNGLNRVSTLEKPITIHKLDYH